MRRRDFVFGLAGSVFYSLPAFSQQRAVPVIGYFGVGITYGPFADRMAAFRDGLRRGGFVEGRNVVIEYRWTEEGYNQLPKIAAELVNRGVDVIVTGNSAVAAKAATSTIPLVCLFGGDPVKSGLVSSPNKPGANLTGVSLFAFSLGAKRFQLLHDLLPNATLMAVSS